MKFKANLRKSILTILILLPLIGNQKIYSQILIGPKIGVRSSWVSFEEDEFRDLYKVKSKIGYSAGITFGFRVRERFFLQSDLMFTKKGKKMEGNVDALLDDNSVYNYIDLPIVYRVEWKSKFRSMDYKWFLGAGPNIGYWWRGRGTLKSSELDENDIEELEYTINFDFDSDTPDQDQLYVNEANRLQFGLIFATGLVFEPYGTQTIMVELKYEWGHSYLAKENESAIKNVLDYFDPMNARNQGIQISVAYLLDTKVSERKKGKSTYDR